MAKRAKAATWRERRPLGGYSTSVEPRTWIRDFAPVAASFLLCPLVALAHRAEAPAAAISRTEALADAERALGAFVEPAVATWAAGQETLLTVSGALYLALHVPVLIAVLAWVYLLRPEVFGRLRTVFLAAQTLTAAGWLLVPTAPPRLLEGAGFSDTLAGLWGAGAAEGASWLQSPYAAMPSGHVVFALLAGGAVVLHARPALVRAAGAAYPVLVVAITVLTANHLWLDAVGAVGVVGLTAGLAAVVHRPARTVGVPAHGAG